MPTGLGDNAGCPSDDTMTPGTCLLVGAGAIETIFCGATVTVNFCLGVDEIAIGCMLNGAGDLAGLRELVLATARGTTFAGAGEPVKRNIKK